MSGIEILGIAASVIQIADVGARISVKLFTFTIKVKDANRNIQKISSELGATGAALRELGNLLQDEEIASIGREEGLVAIKDLVSECWQLFDQIDELLGKDSPPTRKGSRTGAIQRTSKPYWAVLKQHLKFPFRENQIELLVSKLESLKSSLMLMLQILNTAAQIRFRPQSPVQGINQVMKVLAQEREDQQRRFDHLLQALEQTNIQPTVVNNITTMHVANTRVHVLPKARSGGEDETKLQDTHRELQHYSRLVQSLLDETRSTHYVEITEGLLIKTREILIRFHRHHWHNVSPLANRLTSSYSTVPYRELIEYCNAPNTSRKVQEGYRSSAYETNKFAVTESHPCRRTKASKTNTKSSEATQQQTLIAISAEPVLTQSAARDDEPDLTSDDLELDLDDRVDPNIVQDTHSAASDQPEQLGSKLQRSNFVDTNSPNGRPLIQRHRAHHSKQAARLASPRNLSRPRVLEWSRRDRALAEYVPLPPPVPRRRWNKDPDIAKSALLRPDDDFEEKRFEPRERSLDLSPCSHFTSPMEVSMPDPTSVDIPTTFPHQLNDMLKLWTTLDVSEIERAGF